MHCTAPRAPARRRLSFAVAGLALAFLPATGALAQSADATGSDFDQIKRIQQEAATRNADLHASIDDMLTSIEDMKRLAFQIDLRIARIRHNDFERDCTDAGKEIAGIDQAEAHLDEMLAEAETLCRGVSDGNVDATRICTARRDDLASRRTQLEDSRKTIALACPRASKGAAK